MSRQNVEMLQRGIGALNRADLDAIRRILHPDAEWRPALTAGGDLEGTVYKGLAGVAEYLSDLEATFTTTRFHIESLDPIDADRIFYRGRVTAEGRNSGVQLDVPIWAIWEFRDGKVFRGTAFLDENEALEAVGMGD